MTPEQLKALPLSPALGYKVKKGGIDRCFFRYSPDQVAWLEVVTGMFYRDEAAVKVILAYEMKFGWFVVFQCCCNKCFTAEAKAIGIDYMERTGQQISHGYFSECAAKMNDLYENADVGIPTH